MVPKKIKLRENDIFAGFRSRVTFYSVLDPKRTCCYISEVLDAGLLGPLFRVCVILNTPFSVLHPFAFLWVTCQLSSET